MEEQFIDAIARHVADIVVQSLEERIYGGSGVRESEPLKYYSLNEVAEIMGMSRQTIMSKVNAGKFPAPEMFGNIMRWRMDSLKSAKRTPQWK